MLNDKYQLIILQRKILPLTYNAEIKNLFCFTGNRENDQWTYYDNRTIKSQNIDTTIAFCNTKKIHTGELTKNIARPNIQNLLLEIVVGSFIVIKYKKEK